MHSNVTRRLMAVTLIFAISVLLTGMPLLAAETSTFQGRVFEEDGLTPLSGVVVRLVNPESQVTFDSSSTGADGNFLIETAPAGDYVLLAKSTETVFLAADSLSLESGANRHVSISLQPTTALAPAQSKKKKGLPMWGKIGIGGAIALAALFLIDDVSEDVEEDASPF